MILMSVPHGAAAGNIVRTGVLSRILDADPSLSIVILSPMAADDAFVKEIAHPRVTVEPLAPHQPAGVEARLMALMQAAYLESGVTESVKIRRAEAEAKGTLRWIGAKRAIATAFAPSLIGAGTRYDLIDRFVSHRAAETLFDRHRPRMLVTSSPGLIFAEVPLLRTARRRGVRTIAIDPSWDNFTNKLLPVRRVNRLVVWNGLMKAQAVDLHGYQSDEVRLAGVPQWDRYFSEGVTTTREAFCRRIGADPARKLVTLTTTPQELYPHHDHVLRVMTAAMRDGQWPMAQVLVRLHPRDDIAKYAAFEGTANVIIEHPFRRTVRAGDGMAVDVTVESQRHLADTLAHSDVIVNVASTLAIEAAIFDTPVVNIAFDGEREEPFARSARRYYQFTHYANITRHGAVRVASAPGQLVEHVRSYLSDHTQDRAARAEVVREQCWFTDGRSAERVAGLVVDEWKGANSSSCAASPA
jgi:hypothetical protein